MKKKYSIAILLLILLGTGCNSLLESVLPDNVKEEKDAIKSGDDLQEVLNSAYDVVANAHNGNTQRFAELLADNINVIGNSGFLIQVFNRQTDFFNSDIGSLYNDHYRSIFRANDVLENVGRLSLSQSEADRFEGEAKFIRAISHFELVRLFAQPYGYTPNNSHLGIVIKTSTEIAPLSRNTVAEVYEQIIVDLKDAEAKLPETNGVYATAYAAKAYLAKVYFQMNDFENASLYASEVTAEFSFVEDDINARFTKVLSPETVFGTVSMSINDVRSGLFRDHYRSINPDPEDPDNTEAIGSPFFRSSIEYYTFMRSNPADLRASWVAEKTYSNGNAYVFTKFDSVWFSVSLASVTEMKLIAAESNAEQGVNLTAAINHINDIKTRANVAPLSTGASAAAIIAEARIERRKEFGGEGNRLHELRRIGTLGEDVLIRNSPWDCNGMVLQFPASERSIQGFVLNPQGGCN